MIKDIVIEGEAMIGLCVLLVLVLFAQYAYNKAYGSIEERTQDMWWALDDPYPHDTIACEGCGRHTPTHIWRMLGNNCFYGTCVGGRWLLEDWVQQYEDATMAYHNPRFDNDFVLDRLDELQVRNVEINHQQYLED
jgi:hypothetical protein